MQEKLNNKFIAFLSKILYFEIILYFENIIILKGISTLYTQYTRVLFVSTS